MFFNDVAFPANESGDEAFMRCANAKGASVFCPVRWKTLQKWIDSTKQVSPLSTETSTTTTTDISFCVLFWIQTASFLKPKIKPLFYDAPPNKTTASCGISVRGEYNPTVCFHGYVEKLGCKVSAYQTLPFFMDNFGPKYTEYTTTAHEQSPGHHLEVGEITLFSIFNISNGNLFSTKVSLMNLQWGNHLLSN